METEAATKTCVCSLPKRDGEVERYEHKSDCPEWAPYFEFVWAWLWDYPNHKSEFRRALTKEEIPQARKSLSLAMAYRWAYSEKNSQMDPRDLQSGAWIDKASLPLRDGEVPANARHRALYEAKRVWQAFKSQGAMPEIPDTLIWDGEFLGVGLCESIPELEEP